MFTIQLEGRTVCHNNGCDFRLEPESREETEGSVVPTPSQLSPISLEKAILQYFKADRPPSKYACPTCSSTSHIRDHYTIINPPEMLLIYITRDILNPQENWRDIALTETISLKSVTKDNSALDYEFTGTCLYPGTNMTGTPHIVSLVHARDGGWYYASEHVIQKVSSWQEFDTRQQAPTKEADRYLPHILFFERKASGDQELITSTGKRRKFAGNASMADPNKRAKRSPSPGAEEAEAFQNMTLRDIEDRSTRQKIRDLHDCFPNFSRQAIHDTLLKNKFSIDRSIKAL
jgi:hypothetical protein